MLVVFGDAGPVIPEGKHQQGGGKGPATIRRESAGLQLPNPARLFQVTGEVNIYPGTVSSMYSDFLALVDETSDKSWEASIKVGPGDLLQLFGQSRNNI